CDCKHSLFSSSQASIFFCSPKVLIVTDSPIISSFNKSKSIKISAILFSSSVIDTRLQLIDKVLISYYRYFFIVNYLTRIIIVLKQKIHAPIPQIFPVDSSATPEQEYLSR